MKTTFMIAFVALGLTAVSCKKDKEATTPGTPALKAFYLKLDGTPYTASASSSQHTMGLILYSTAIGTDNFYLRIEDTLQPGTYDILPNGVFLLNHNDASSSSTGYSSISGSVTITSNNAAAHNISGTYHCVLEKADLSTTKQVTEAEFNITYP